MDLGLRGLKAIVTGATKGIGRGVIELLVAEGASVAFCARTADEVAEAVEAVKRPDVDVFGEAVNVRDAEAYKSWLARAVTALGGCDIFVPGVSGGGGMDSEKNWVRNFEIDMLHTVRGCEALMPYLEKSASGSIVTDSMPKTVSPPRSVAPTNGRSPEGTGTAELTRTSARASTAAASTRTNSASDPPSASRIVVDAGR